jgi:subtilisin family serine protease
MALQDYPCAAGRAARTRPAVRLGLAVLVLLGAAGAAAAAPPEIRIEPGTVYFGPAPAGAASTAAVAAKAAAAAPRPGLRSEVLQALRAKAASGSAVRVIVRLSASFRPEGSLEGSRAVRSQRQAIDAVQSSALSKLAGSRAALHARYEYIPFLALEVDAAALEKLVSLPEVVGIEEDVLERPSLATSNAVIGSGAAVSMGLTGSGKVIAVLDTGVDKTHPFFAGGKVVAEACYSSNTASSASLCPGGAPESTAPGSGASCPADLVGCDHGTHVAGIAAGNDSAGPGFGVARDAGIIAIQVFSEAFCGYGYSCVGSWISDQVKALERVYTLAGEHDIAAVNMSLGGFLYGSRASCDAANASRKAAIDNLRSIDIATIAASGNEGYTGYIAAPACISSAVSVGATDDADEVPYFSNVASFLDLLAPGVDIESSVPGGGTASFDGTSMATPHVAGAWAVLKAAHPSATVADILAILRDTGVPVSNWGVNGMRRINLGKAVLAGPYVAQAFSIHNDGAGLLSILSMELEQPVSWIKWSPEAPFDVLPGESRVVTVSVDFSRAPDGESNHRLLVGSTDADENPYPDGVHLVVNKQPCHTLARSRTGSGGHPEPVPSSSPGCPAGQYHAGTTVQLVAHPATGWGLQSWSGTDDDASTALTNTVTVPAGGSSVSVAYFAHCYTLTRTHTGSGDDPLATPAHSPGCPAGQYRYAEAIALAANPAAGWRVGSWDGTSKDASFAKTNSLLMPAGHHTVTVDYLEGLPAVLLVDDDGNFGLEYAYISALDALGVIYHVWTVQADGQPDAATLSAYPRVFWFTNYYSRLNATAETTLAAYLEGGGSLLLSSQAYGSQGLTAFAQGYLGAQAASSFDDYRYTVTGEGTAFGGLGPFDFYSYAFALTPAPGAEPAFRGHSFGTSEVIGVSKIGPKYRTIYLGFGFHDFDEGHPQILAAAIDFLGAIFADVAPKHWARRWIEAIYDAGLTQGCATNPRRYCPGENVTREQMAVFLLRGLEGKDYAPPPCSGTSPFGDVSTSSFYCPWIQELANRGITVGCGGGNYCPSSPVTRDQMAVFLMRALEGRSYTPVPCEGAPFADVQASNLFCPWIRDLAGRGITSGCGGGNYCPASPTSRAEMAVFLVRTFDLPLP